MYACYTPPSYHHWQGRKDGRFHETVQLINLETSDLSFVTKRAIAIIGFACDEGIKRNMGRPGAQEGPKAFRQALAKLPVHHLDNALLVDVGDVSCDDDHLELAQETLGSIVANLHNHGYLTFVIGGGHELAWGHYLGIYNGQSKKQPSENEMYNLEIVNFDAHYDCRPLIDGQRGSSGTSFLQIYHHRLSHQLPFSYTCLGIQKEGNTNSLFQTAKELQISTVLAEDFYNNNLQPVESIEKILHASKPIYLSLCLDVFAACYAPGVSAPQPLGLTPWQVIPLLKKLAKSNRVIGFDIAELSPAYDRDGMTASLAAHLFAAFFSSLKALPGINP